MKIPDTRVCSVAGIMAAGAICAHTLTDETEDLTLTQFLEFLEPSPTHGAAICISTEDFASLQAALEQACEKLKACTKETKEQIRTISLRLKKLQKKRNA